MPPQLIRNLPLTYPPGFPSMSSAPAISIVEDLQAALTLLAAIFALAAEAGLRPRSMSRWIRRKAWSLMVLFVGLRRGKQDLHSIQHKSQTAMHHRCIYTHNGSRLRALPRDWWLRAESLSVEEDRFYDQQFGAYSFHHERH